MSEAPTLQFLTGASSPRLLRLMQALGVAESLTDEVARQVLKASGLPHSRVDAFLELLHCADYVVPRNSEWHFSADVRAALRQSARDDDVPLKGIHALLLEIGENGDRTTAGDQIPAYLFTDAGAAYHKGELGFVEEALQQYARAADVTENGELWLAGTLSQEQQRLGVFGPDVVEPTFLQALSAYRDKHEDQAYPALLSVARSGKRSDLVAWAMQLAGEIEMRRAQLDDALEHLNQAVDLFLSLRSWNRCVWALAARAAAHRMRGTLPAALEDLKQAIFMCRGDWRALLLCRAAVIEHELHRSDQALAALDEAERAADQVLAIVLIQRAGLKRLRSDHIGALHDLDRAVVAASPGHRSVALNTRATVYWELGRWAEAKKDLDHALQASQPQNRAVILNTRSCVKRDEGDFVGALADCQLIGELPPRLRHEHDMEIVGSRSKQLRAAVANLNRASAENRLDSFWFKHFYSTAQAALKARVWYRAVELLMRALPHAHTDAERAKCLRWIGVAYEKTIESKARAIDPLKQAIQFFPHDSVALATLGHVLYLEGQSINEVAPYFLRAIEADPQNAWARSWYALALSAAGRHDDAIQYAKEAVGDTPHAVLLLNLALVLDSSPRSEDRLQAIECARKAASLAKPGFDAPVRFLKERLAG